ncbi:ferritin [bacterium]|nr:ferritin [bacterium]
MINERIENELNKQITKEFYSAYMYLAMSTYFFEEGLTGFQHWLKEQAKEECEHAMKFINYIILQGGKVKLEMIETPPNEWECHLCVMETALEHEKYISRSILDLVKIAEQEDDKATQNFLDTFVDEQVEEEASFRDIIRRLNMVGDSESGWVLVDKELAERG